MVSSSHGLLRLHHHPPLRLFAAASSYKTRCARLRLRVSTPRLPPRIPSSPDPPPDVADDQDHKEDRDERYGFEIRVRKQPKRNRRLVQARVRVDAPLEAVWATLTDYEGLADFIPGLSECRLLDQGTSFARLYQVGEQDLALGFKFDAKGTIDCYEAEMQQLPAGARRREIAFNMIDGDFKVFEGKWSVQDVMPFQTISTCHDLSSTHESNSHMHPNLGHIALEFTCSYDQLFIALNQLFCMFVDSLIPADLDTTIKHAKNILLVGDLALIIWFECAEQVDGGGISADQQFQTTLSYVVELEPKLWVPVRLLEGRVCNEIKTNLVSIREEAQRIQRLQDE
ncbi:hypothetical protein ABZP36_015372 [Zizania latifolia]